MKNGELVHFEKEWRIVKNGSKYGIEDSIGNLICPCIYSYIGTFDFGYAVVKVKKNFFAKEQWGIINEKCEVNFFSEDYENLFPISSKLLAAKVKVNKGEYKFQLIKKSGEIISAPKYDFIPVEIGEGFFRCQINGWYTLINENGAQISKAKYLNIEYSPKRPGCFRADKGCYQYEFINKNGVVIKK